MRTSDDIRREIETYAGEFIADFDINGITDELKEIPAFDAREGYASIDTIGADVFEKIVQRHEKQCNREEAAAW